MRRDTAGQMRREARRILFQQVSDGSEAYLRRRDLWRILPQAALDDQREEPARTRKIILSLLQALRQERRLGGGGHWSYDLNRHIALAQALKAERATLAALVHTVRSCAPDRETSRPSPPPHRR